jgi:hypothetical protein
MNFTVELDSPRTRSDLQEYTIFKSVYAIDGSQDNIAVGRIKRGILGNREFTFYLALKSLTINLTPAWIWLSDDNVKPRRKLRLSSVDDAQDYFNEMYKSYYGVGDITSAFVKENGKSKVGIFRGNILIGHVSSIVQYGDEYYSGDILSLDWTMTYRYLTLRHPDGRKILFSTLREAADAIVQHVTRYYG